MNNIEEKPRVWVFFSRMFKHRASWAELLRTDAKAINKRHLAIFASEASPRWKVENHCLEDDLGVLFSSCRKYGSLPLAVAIDIHGEFRSIKKAISSLAADSDTLESIDWRIMVHTSDERKYGRLMRQLECSFADASSYITFTTNATGMRFDTDEWGSFWYLLRNGISVHSMLHNIKAPIENLRITLEVAEMALADDLDATDCTDTMLDGTKLRDVFIDQLQKDGISATDWAEALEVQREALELKFALVDDAVPEDRKRSLDRSFGEVVESALPILTGSTAEFDSLRRAFEAWQDELDRPIEPLDE